MQHHIIKTLLFSASLSKVHRTFFTLALGAMLLTSCGKDNKDNGTIIGKWANTAQSCEITIAGQENILEGYISMEFTDSQVWVSDQRANCLPEWHGYTLSKESGKQLLEIEGGCHAGIFVVEELTNDKLVLAPEHHEIDMDFRYIMKRR
ncbi:MAG: hypothetical protein IJQ14_03545 [Bacteroidales bacterium]|nr:hypothetical protein [Bacteroidales bacterium]